LPAKIAASTYSIALCVLGALAVDTLSGKNARPEGLAIRKDRDKFAAIL
jgi:hypothetical protein